MKKYKRYLLTAAASVALGLNCLAVTAEEDENKAFEEFMNSEFKEMMESDYLTLHFTIKDYSALDIDKPELEIGEASWESYEEAYQEGVETMEKLHSFDRSKLSAENQIDYDTYEFYLQRMNELNSMPYLDFIFQPNGVIDNLTVNFTEFVFYKEEDFNDYLEVLSTVDSYLDECLEVTKKQAAEGYFLSDAALEQTLDSIDKFVAKTDDNELIVIFEKNVDAFEGISDSDRQEYKDRNRDIVLNTYIPAYAKVGEELRKLQGSRTAGDSVYDLPGGKEYYESFLKLKASTDKTPQELFDIMDRYLRSAMTDYLMAVYFGSAAMDEARPEEDPDTVLHFLQDNLQDFPDGPKVNFRSSYLDPSVANPSIVAYYMEPPIDDLVDNVIRINGDNVSDSNEMYTTLAHEGFPGHCYQITWFLNQNPNPVRTQISNLGYTEGWAMYVQDYAWRNSGLSESAAELQRMDQNVNYILSAICDIAVNGLGYDVEKLGAYFEDLGLGADFAQNMYDFVGPSPGLIVPYGAGLVQFLILKDTAEQSLGDDFDLKEFNTVLLTGGDRPFELVKADVDAYIASKGKTAVTPEYSGTGLENLDLDQLLPSSRVPAMITGGVLLALVILFLILRHNTSKKDVFKE